MMWAACSANSAVSAGWSRPYRRPDSVVYMKVKIATILSARDDRLHHDRANARRGHELVMLVVEGELAQELAADVGQKLEPRRQFHLRP